MLVSSTTCQNVSWKLKTSCWWKPFSTSLALYLLTLSFGFSFTLNTHFHPIGFLLGGIVNNVQVPFFNSESCSVFMASYQSGMERACLVVCFSVYTRKTLSLDLLVLDLINMGWLLTNVFEVWCCMWKDVDNEFVDLMSRFCDQEILMTFVKGYLCSCKKH